MSAVRDRYWSKKLNPLLLASCFKKGLLLGAAPTSSMVTSLVMNASRECSPTLVWFSDSGLVDSVQDSES